MTRPQLHLSTLLIVSLLAAILLWLNVRSTTWLGDGPFGETRELTGGGWPAISHYSYTLHANRGVEIRQVVNWPIMIQDAAVCLALLLLCTIALEFTTRRLKSRPTAP